MMKALLAALAVLAAAPAMAQSAAAPTACDYQGTNARPGDRFLTNRMIVSRDGRCSHAMSGVTGDVRLVSPPQHGRVDVSSSSLTYVPAAGFSGTDQFTFSRRASSGAGTVEVTVAVTVQ
jgi:hypothetical protein